MPDLLPLSSRSGYSAFHLAINVHLVETIARNRSVSIWCVLRKGLVILRGWVSQFNDRNAASRRDFLRQRDLSVSNNRLGDVAVLAGQPNEAKRRFEQSLATAEQLAKSNPSSAEAQRDLSVSRYELAKSTGSPEHWRNAFKILSVLKKRGPLSPTDFA